MNLLEVKLEKAECAGMLQDGKNFRFALFNESKLPDFCLLKRMFVTF